MKKIGIILTAAFLLAGFAVTEQVSAQTDVYYFHMKRRCMTCQTVEKVSQDAVNEQFADAVKKGEITFKSVDLEEKENKALVKKLKVQGQTLLIVNGKEQVNLTDKAFMYAVKEPAKLKEEIKAGIEKVKK